MLGDSVVLELLSLSGFKTFKSRQESGVLVLPWGYFQNIPRAALSFLRESPPGLIETHSLFLFSAQLNKMDHQQTKHSRYRMLPFS